MSKMVLYSGFSLLLAFHILAVAKSNCIWQAQAVLHNQASSLLPDVVKSQGFGLSVTCVGFAALMLEVRPTSNTRADLVDDPLMRVLTFNVVQCHIVSSMRHFGCKLVPASCQLRVCTVVSMLTAAWPAVLSGDKSPWRG